MGTKGCRPGSRCESRRGRMRSRYLCALVVLVTSASVQAQSIYKQSVFLGDGFSSAYDPAAVFAFLAADNFTLTSPQAVGGVRWWGNSDNFTLPDLQNFTDFTVTLHQRQASGLPGPVVYQEEFTTAETSPVDTGLLSVNNTRVWQQTAPLTIPQVLVPGQYMLAVGVSGYVNNQGSIWFWN